MALTETQKLKIKKHLNQHPTSTIINPLFEPLEDGGAMELELTTCITSCDTALTAIQTAQTAADELVEGGGAKFSYANMIAIKKRAYREEVTNLARLIGWPMPAEGEIVGVYKV